MSKIVTFGEMMMRLNPKGYRRIVQADHFDVSYSGAEANVAVSLAQYGEDVFFVSKIPDNEIGQACVNSLLRFGVDTKHIKRGGNRLGIYFVEKGASQRASKVIYDRENSAIAQVRRTEFDWPSIFEEISWFHFTGITPALGGELPEICLDACTTAKEMGVTISCDLNYRNKLWSRSTAKDTMEKLMPYVDVCIANEEDAADVFGIRAENTYIEAGRLSKEGYVNVAKQIKEQYGCSKVAVTLRSSINANVNKWAGMFYSDDKAYFSKEYTIQIVDRVGSGDSFCAGLIFSLLHGYDSQRSIEFAIAASCLKHTIEDDFNLVSVPEVEALMQGNGSGRVER